MTADRIAKLEPRQKPEAKQIIQEVNDAITTAQSIGAFDKITRAHMTRRCLWAGQSDDGMLHGDDAFPWPLAIDSRVPLADEIVSDHVRVRMEAVRSGTVQIGPEDEIADSGKAKQWNDVLKYYRGQIRRGLKSNLKLFFTCIEEIGYGVLKVDWRDNRVLKPKQITVAQLVSFEAQRAMETVQTDAAGNEMQADQNLIAAEAVLRVEEMMMAEDDASIIAMLQTIDPDMPESEAAKTARALRKTGGPATYYAPASNGGNPVVKAHIPWVTCGHAMDLGPEGQCSYWFEVEWLSEADLRIRATQDGWSDKWLEEVISKGKNKGLSEMMQGVVNIPDWLLNGVGIGLKYDRQSNQNAPMFQVVTVYRLAVNVAGIPACYETVVNACVPDMLGKHECCSVRQLPFVAEGRESAALMIQSRGVPEIVLTEQLALKKLQDGCTHMAELSSFPPYERAMGDSTRIAPGTELPVKRNTGTNGTSSRFLELPGVDKGALEQQKMIRANVDRLFVRGAEVDPDDRRRYLEDLGESAVSAFEDLMALIWQHVQAYVNEIRASRIAGQPVSVTATAEDLEGTADVTVEFSAMAMNKKQALELADYVTKLAALDKSGRIDFGRAVELITRIFDPVLSENIIMPGEVAAAEIEKDEQAVLSAIGSGQYITGRTNSPQLRWQQVQRWLANPETQAMLQTFPNRYAALQEHIKGLQQEQVQSSTNVFTGQTGQKPQAPWEEQAKMEERTKMMVEGGERMAA